MKAIRKSDGKIIDVEVHGWNGDCAISYHTDFKDFYKPEDLDFNVVETKDVGTTEKPFDWQSFRAEAAKDILCAIIASPAINKFKDERGKLIDFCKEKACGISIQYAEELVKQLKGKEEK